MAITDTTEKRRLIGVVGEAGIIASWQWDALRFFRDDSTGADVAPPQTVTLPCTDAEMAAYIGAAATALQSAQLSLNQRVAQLASDLAAVTAERDAALAAAQAVKQADTLWDQAVRPLIDQVTTAAPV